MASPIKIRGVVDSSPITLHCRLMGLELGKKARRRL